jgi:hypothetical protein
MLSEPTRIDLLELDIDLRLTDLWREAVDVTDWNLEVVAAFIRAAYGKGYCDALTEESPGSLCVDHGYRIPDRPAARHLRSVSSTSRDAQLGRYQSGDDESGDRPSSGGQSSRGESSRDPSGRDPSRGHRFGLDAA